MDGLEAGLATFISRSESSTRQIFTPRILRLVRNIARQLKVSASDRLPTLPQDPHQQPWRIIYAGEYHAL